MLGILTKQTINEYKRNEIKIFSVFVLFRLFSWFSFVFIYLWLFFIHDEKIITWLRHDLLLNRCAGLISTNW